MSRKEGGGGGIFMAFLHLIMSLHFLCHKVLYSKVSWHHYWKCFVLKLFLQFQGQCLLLLPLLVCLPHVLVDTQKLVGSLKGYLIFKFFGSFLFKKWKKEKWLDSKVAQRVNLWKFQSEAKKLFLRRVKPLFFSIN